MNKYINYLQHILEEQKKEKTNRTRLFEAAKSTKLDKVIVELDGNESAAATRLAKEYKRLLEEQKALTEKIDDLKGKAKQMASGYFDAKEELFTRILNTVSMTITISKESKRKSEKFDVDGAFGAIAKLVPELTKKIEDIRKKFTEVKETAVKSSVKVDVKESAIGDIIKKVKDAAKKFLDSIKTWGKSYDTKLNNIKTKYLKKG